MTENRKPLAVCPYCEWKAYSVMGAWGRAQHIWEAHGIAGSFTCNGVTKVYGPQETGKQEPPSPETPEKPKLRLGRRLQTCQFFENRPLNIAFNVFVAFPIALFASGFLAIAITYPLVKLTGLDKVPDSGGQTCNPTPFGCE